MSLLGLWLRLELRRRRRSLLVPALHVAIARQAARLRIAHVLRAE